MDTFDFNECLFDDETTKGRATLSTKILSYRIRTLQITRMAEYLDFLRARLLLETDYDAVEGVYRSPPTFREWWETTRHRH